MNFKWTGQQWQLILVTNRTLISLYLSKSNENHVLACSSWHVIQAADVAKNVVESEDDDHDDDHWGGNSRQISKESTKEHVLGCWTKLQE